MAPLKSMPKRQNIEESSQIALMRWAALNEHNFPELKFLHASPNGGLRHLSVARKMKATGTKAGFPDLVLPVKRGRYSGLFIEMKAPKGRMSDAQKEWADFLLKQDFYFACCHGWDEAAGVLRSYLNSSKL